MENLPTNLGENRGRKTKGVSFLNVRNYVISLYGADTWEKVLGRLGPEDRHMMLSVAGVGWYELAFFSRLLRAADSVCGSGDLSLVRIIGVYGAEQDFNRAIRTLLRVLEPMSIFKMQKRIWKHFQTSGEIELTRVEGGADMIMNDWAEDEVLCTELSGYLEALIKFTGGKSVSVTHPECKARGDKRCLFQHRWK